MKIAIIGAGAMGCLYGGKLSAVQGNQVFLLDIWQEHVNAINRYGLFMEEQAEITNYNRLVAKTKASDVGVVDLAIVFVKSTLTEQAIRSNLFVFGPNTITLTLQNGMGNIDLICSVIGAKNVIAGTTAHGATMLGPGKMRHAGTGKTFIGELGGEISERVSQLAEIFNHANLETEISENVLGLVWDKLLINVGINALTAITKLQNGGLLAHQEIEAILEAAVTEGISVAKAKNISLSFADAVAHTKEIAAATGTNKSSMLQDVLNHRQTEIDMINGAIVREGKAVGILTPVNMVLTNLVHFIEKSG